MGEALAKLVIESSAAQQVKVEMRYKLAALWATTDGQAIALLRNAFLIRHRLRRQYQAAHQALVVLGEVCQRTDVRFGHNQDMFRRLGMYVPESQELIILIDNISRDLPRYDLAEQAIHVTALN